jgi:predicted 2-oxoglutarate/Fe(II)-dependent dioxygenase YbiX
LPSPDFFARLGFLVVEEFVDATFLAALLPELEAASSRPAEFYRVATGWRVNEDIRRAKWLESSTGMQARLSDRLDRLKPTVEDHFQLTLEAFEPPQFLRYEAGDYMRLHVDTEANAEGELGQRKVSVIVFFNDQAGDGVRGSYEGGSLVFGLRMPSAASPQGSGSMISLPLSGRAGLLVAFPSQIPHEVQPVNHGVRYSGLTWFR